MIINIVVDEENKVENDKIIKWEPTTGQYLKTFPTPVAASSVKDSLFDELIGKSPIDFFNLFVDDEIINLMVMETNRYAWQKISNETLKPNARLKQWKDTNSTEMREFLGIQIWMGLCRFPSFSSYWSKDFLYANKVKDVMSRNRFELLLSNWHFSDNQVLSSDRLRKITPLMLLLINKFKTVITPGENVCIDETLVPFRGRLSFRQYIQNKRHKYGVKVFKLCTENGYTYDFKIYCGTERDPSQTVPTSVVMKLVEPLLNSSRTVYVDNYYTSVELARKLLSQQTHLVGTLRKNRKNNPKEVTEKRLSRGEIASAECNEGIVILKWQDKKDVLMLSTKHVDNKVKVNTRSGEVEKPEAVRDYNKCKSYIDLSDQVKAYASSLRRGIKWYRKIAVEILLGSAMVNAFLIYKHVNGISIKITNFRESVARSMLEGKINKQALPSGLTDNEDRHFLEDVGTARRRRCVTCYKAISEKQGRKVAVHKTPSSRWRCTKCEQHYCVTCFTQTHICNK